MLAENKESEMLIKTDNGFLDKRNGSIFSVPYDNADSVAITAAKTMVNGDVIFTISNVVAS